MSDGVFKKKKLYSFFEGALSVLGLKTEPILLTDKLTSIFVLSKPKPMPILCIVMNNPPNARHDKFVAVSTR